VRLQFSMIAGDGRGKRDTGISFKGESVSTHRNPTTKKSMIVDASIGRIK